jgi:hypothetical protein
MWGVLGLGFRVEGSETIVSVHLTIHETLNPKPYIRDDRVCAPYEPWRPSEVQR